jgi:uncharacterized membrane protein YsdA (DUF1294 family)
MPASVHERRIAFGSIAACVGVMAWLISRGLKVGTHGSIDFFDFYWAAQAFPRDDIYAVGDPGYIYPPLLAFLMQPLTLLGENGAATLWVFLTAALAAVLCWLGVDTARRALGITWPRERTIIASCASFLFLADGFRNELEWGNCNLIILAPVLLAIRWLATRPVLAGVLLAIAAALKYLPILFLVWLLARRQWRAAAAMLVALVTLLLAPALQVGWDRNAQFLDSSVRGVSTMLASKVSPPGAPHSTPHSTTAPANIWPLDATFSLSIPSGMARIVRDNSLAKWVLPAGVLGVAALCVVACGVVYRAHAVRLFWRTVPHWLLIAEGVGVATAMVAFSPQTQKRHFNMLVGLVAWGLVLALAPGRPRASRTTAIIALAFLGALTTPMLNTPWTRDFATEYWNWSGGPSYVAVICQIMIVAATMALMEPPAHTALPPTHVPTHE